jgi:hypothetical protein
MGKILSATAILEAKDLDVVREEVPEWKDDEGNPGVVVLHELDAKESIELARETDTVDKANDGMFLMLVYCAKDEDGNRLFTLADIPALRKKSFRVLNRLQHIALRLNKMEPNSEVTLKKE